MTSIPINSFRQSCQFSFNNININTNTRILLRALAEHIERHVQPFNTRYNWWDRAFTKGDYTHRHMQVAHIIHQELAIKCFLTKEKPTSCNKYDPQSALVNSYYTMTNPQPTIELSITDQMYIGVQSAFSCHIFVSSSFRFVYFCSLLVMVLQRLRLLGILTSMKYASFIVFSRIRVIATLCPSSRF
jgi:hypothetical protein